MLDIGLDCNLVYYLVKLEILDIFLVSFMEKIYILDVDGYFKEILDLEKEIKVFENLLKLVEGFFGFKN